MKKFLMLSMFFCLPVFADISEAVDADEIINAGEFDMQMCVDTEANNCIVTSCLTSEERDCQDNCQSGAEDTCKLRASGLDASDY